MRYEIRVNGALDSRWSAAPLPPRKLRLAGSQAMSPAAAITGGAAGRLVASRSAGAAGVAVRCGPATRPPSAAAVSSGAGGDHPDIAASASAADRPTISGRPRRRAGRRRSHRAADLKVAVVGLMPAVQQLGSTALRQLADGRRKAAGRLAGPGRAGSQRCAVMPGTRR